MRDVTVQLFLGDTNRTICETPMNMASSRSHCMFMVHLEARKVRRRAIPAPGTSGDICGGYLRQYMTELRISTT